MNLGGHRDEGEGGFQIAPMIDTVFILLVFFVATYAAAQEERLLNLTLPAAGAAQEERQSLSEIVVNLDSEGAIFLHDRRLAPEAFAARIGKLAAFVEDPGVIIRADRACPHGAVVRVMDICRKAGVSRIAFSALPDEESGSPE